MPMPVRRYCDGCQFGTSRLTPCVTGLMKTDGDDVIIDLYLCGGCVQQARLTSHLNSHSEPFRLQFKKNALWVDEILIHNPVNPTGKMYFS